MPLVAVIVALGVYPNFVVQRTERATVERIAPARAVADSLARAEAARERRAERLKLAERTP